MTAPVLDRVLAVVENAVEALVQMGHVIAAVEVVVDEHLPVAVESVVAPLHPVKPRKLERSNLVHELRGEEFFEGQSALGKANEYPVLPGGGGHRHESMFGEV